MAEVRKGTKKHKRKHALRHKAEEESLKRQLQNLAEETEAIEHDVQRGPQMNEGV